MGLLILISPGAPTTLNPALSLNDSDYSILDKTPRSSVLQMNKAFRRNMMLLSSVSTLNMEAACSSQTLLSTYQYYTVLQPQSPQSEHSLP
jgi:hypothetical protein